MRCESTKRKLSTWANEPHTASETRHVEQHLASCVSCRAYRERVASLDLATASVEIEPLVRDLRPEQRSSSAMPRRIFTARNIAAASGVAAMVVAARFVSQFAIRHPASASDSLRRMAQVLEGAPAFHQRTWIADGDQLRLSNEVWYEHGRWRTSSPGDRGGDRIVRREGANMAYYTRAHGGTVSRAVRVESQPVQEGLAGFLTSLGLAGYESSSIDVGTTRLGGRTVDEILVPSAGDQRTLIWMVSGSDRPVRIEKQNNAGNGWHAIWADTFDFADHWPESTFDPNSLADKRPTSGSNAVLAPHQPAWKTGNVLFAGLISDDRQRVADACLNPKAAKAIQTTMSALIGEYGPLTGYGSIGPGHDSFTEIGVTIQDFDLTFRDRKVTLNLIFHRDEHKIWKATGITGRVP